MVRCWVWRHLVRLPSCQSNGVFLVAVEAAVSLALVDETSTHYGSMTNYFQISKHCLDPCTTTISPSHSDKSTYPMLVPLSTYQVESSYRLTKCKFSLCSSPSSTNDPKTNSEFQVKCCFLRPLWTRFPLNDWLFLLLQPRQNPLAQPCDRLRRQDSKRRRPRRSFHSLHTTIEA